MKPKFELFMGCLGNGITVCNKAVMESGDYKTIAHIGYDGCIKLYVKEGYIPAEEMKRIQNAADTERVKYLKWWESMPIMERYERLLDLMLMKDFTAFLKINKEIPLEERIRALEQKYIYKSENELVVTNNG